LGGLLKKSRHAFWSLWKNHIVMGDFTFRSRIVSAWLSLGWKNFGPPGFSMIMRQQFIAVNAQRESSLGSPNARSIKEVVFPAAIASAAAQCGSGSA
jgi:hypothetical protein